MQLALAIAVALFVLGVAGWPLAVGMWRRTRESGTIEIRADELPIALETVYEAIRTLQVEHDLGRVSREDYQEQLAEYRREAAIILRDMNQTTPDDTVESRP